MRCKKCGDRAQVEMRRHNTSYCGPHYLDFFEDHVARNIKSRRMFAPDDKVLVAVSGGKDSLALWDVLMRLGYRTAGLYIDLGIGRYSERSKEKSVAFAEHIGGELIIHDVRGELGDGEIGVTELSKVLKRVPCSGCGLTKRYVTNETAHRLGYDILATGHNLDDEAATLMGNVLHWQTEYLARQSPVLESTHEKLVRKVKPLYTFTERETLSYVLLRGIDYIEEECPNAAGAKSILYKEALNAIELESPGVKASFMNGFLDRLQPVLREAGGVTLNECAECGEPTPGEVCSHCRMWNRAREAWAKKKVVAAGD